MAWKTLKLTGGGPRCRRLTKLNESVAAKRWRPQYIDAVKTDSPALPVSASFKARLSALRQRWAPASQCAVCKTWPADPVCGACQARFIRLAPRCTRCALLLPVDSSGSSSITQLECGSCVRHPLPIDQTFAAVTYGFPWSGLIEQYKFAEQPGWAAVFAQLMLASPHVAACLAELESADWLVPLPLSAQRLQTRGFNQAWALTTSLAAASATAAVPDAQLLLRIRDTVPQSQLPRVGRIANVRSAFAVNPLRAADIQQRHVVLVDDVMTSGASLGAAAEALRDAGAARVSALVFARTEPS